MALSRHGNKSTGSIPADLTLAWYPAAWFRSGWCIVVTCSTNARQLNETPPASTAIKAHST
jgi:hypothetical protein